MRRRVVPMIAAAAVTCGADACSFTTDASGLVTADREGGADGAAATDARVDGDAPAAIDGSGAADSTNDPSAYHAAVMADRPEGYFRLGEKSGSIAKDEASQALGTYIGGPTLGVAGALAHDPDTAVAFTDASYLSAGDRFGYANGAPLTIEAWVKPTAADGTYRMVLAKRPLVEPVNGYSIYVFEGAVCAEYADNGVFEKLCGPITVGRYSHLVFTKDPGTCRLFVNDTIAQQKDCSTTNIPTTKAELIVGAQTIDGNAPFVGTVDEVALYDHALSVTQVHAHFAAATPP